MTNRVLETTLEAPNFAELATILEGDLEYPDDNNGEKKHVSLCLASNTIDESLFTDYMRRICRVKMNLLKSNL